MGMIHIYLLIFVGINGMSYHWWSPFALLSKPGKQIYGIHKYMVFEEFGTTKYFTIFNYPRIMLEFVTWCFLVLIKTSSGTYCNSQLAYSSGKQRSNFCDRHGEWRNSCKPKRLQHRTWSCTQLPDPSGKASTQTAYPCPSRCPKEQGLEKWAEPSTNQLTLYFPAHFQINTIHFPHN